MDKNALAKSYPEEDIQTHTDCLLKNLELLKELYPNLFSDWDSFYDLLRLACIYHDFGKLYPRFQYCLKNRIPYTDGLPHGLLSLAFIDYKWLKKEKGLKKEELRLLFQAVAYHHDRKMPYDNNEIDKELVKLQAPNNRFAYDKQPSKFLAEEIEAAYFSVGERFNQKDKSLFFRFIMLEGLLNRLDYAASAHIPVEQPPGFLPSALEALMNRWQAKQPEARWNDLQNYMRQHATNNVIAIAQTGMGKTEAGLLWLGKSKGFFTLPLKSAINAIYERLTNDIILEHKEEQVGLLHSDTYSKYLENEQDQKKTEANDAFESEGVSSDLYYTRTRQLSLPLTVCTLDQLFGFVFLYRGFEYKLATLAYSKIIIDEVQMYSPDLIAYLVLGLRYITRMGGQFAVLTATLPAFFLDLLREQEIPFESPQVFTDNRIRHSLKVIDREINARDIADLIRQYGGKKILVICNTIKSVIKLYHQLAWDKEKGQAQAVAPLPQGGETTAESAEKPGVYLLHGNFTKEDRRKKEEHILRMGRKESAESCIWIATQIVEASLDIDFDLLFTELSDLNGLFQRMGRCFRKRILGDLLYNCFVFTGGNRLCSGVGLFIDKEIHRLSKEALSGVDGIIDEAQKVAMVQDLYTREKLPAYYAKIKDTIDYVDCRSPYEINKAEADKRFRDIDTVSVIPRTVFEARQAEIRQAVAVLQKDYDGLDRTQVRELRTKARETIMNLTVDISKYLYKNIETGEKDTIRISDYEQIKIVECDYNSQEGIIRPTMKPKAEVTDFFSHSF
ncbi:MAG: CRISPR-associated helicase Cas3' [Peptococcaceae bacterium]|nr:CRISPR-associated helicase Cas3' [Peptococcaceae bacterium]